MRIFVLLACLSSPVSFGLGILTGWVIQAAHHKRTMNSMRHDVNVALGHVTDEIQRSHQVEQENAELRERLKEAQNAARIHTH